MPRPACWGPLLWPLPRLPMGTLALHEGCYYHRPQARFLLGFRPVRSPTLPSPLPAPLHPAPILVGPSQHPTLAAEPSVPCPVLSQGGPLGFPGAGARVQAFMEWGVAVFGLREGTELRLCLQPPLTRMCCAIGL